ncbi:MAG: hypothetical protein IPJ75_11500 [Ignavibacteriales bacterium]|nr:hypothetical protein [Ignavibacteriales bacterium]
MFQNIKIFFVVFISLTNFTFSQGKVETLFPSPSPNVMNDISVGDNSTAWASTTFGGVLRTVDAGKTWETVKSGGDSWVIIITGVDKNTAWFSLKGQPSFFHS